MSAGTDDSAFPYRQLLGYRMVSFEPDRAQFELTLEHRHMNGDGVPHGGVYASLLDATMGFSGCHTGIPDHRRKAMTLSLSIVFVAPPVGTRLIAVARRIGGGTRTFFSEGQIHDETGLLLAQATGAFRYRRDG
jgi:uncharacterized protein (TIGR00369 family)